jgi:hypothetical protein
LGENAYPFERDGDNESSAAGNANEDSWNSFLFLPPALVNEDDVGIVD